MSKLTHVQKDALIAKLNADLVVAGKTIEALRLRVATAEAERDTARRNVKPSAKQPGAVVGRYVRGDGTPMVKVRVDWKTIVHRTEAAHAAQHDQAVDAADAAMEADVRAWREANAIVHAQAH